MKDTIYLIDGSAYLHRAYHAIRGLATSKGKPTNATFGFTRILLKLIKEKSPQYAAVFFDVKGPTFRHELYEDYKANRPPMPDDMAIQIPDIKRVIKALGIPIIEKQGFEADDLIGTYARLGEDAGFQPVMVTGDKDFMQLITEASVVWDPMKDVIIDTKAVRDKHGISPDQVVELMGLCGDSSDNVPGVPGVGPKTAEKLLAEFSTMESLYDNLEKLKSKKALYAKLKDNRDQAFLSRELVTIDTMVKVDKPVKEFNLPPFDKAALAELFRELEFKRLYQEYAESTPKPAKTYHAVTDTAGVKKLVKTLEQAEIFAVDTETTSKHPMQADLVGLSFSFKPHEAWYIPVGHDDPGIGGQPDRKEVLSLIKPLLENPNVKKVGQNIKYDYIVLKKCGIAIEGIAFDTMIASHLLNPGRRGHSLDRIAMDLLGHKTISFTDVAGKGKNQKTFNRIDIDKAVDYACEDADITLLIHDILAEQIRKKGLEDLLHQVELPLIPVLARMEMNGILVDKAKLSALSKRFKDEMTGIEAEIYEMAGENFNINSSQQLGVILFEKLALPVQKKTKKKTGYSTDVEVLTKLAEDHPLPEKILRYRSLGKLKSTYSDALQEMIHPETRRIHTSFNQSITATGRLSSSDPNLQNIPVRTDEGKMIRETFVPEQGQLLISADYSQIELRILAHCADDEILIQAFKEGKDIHSRTAAEVFQVFPDFVTEDLRRQAKAINFGIVYGMSAFGLAKQLGISRKMAQTYIDHYFARYRGVKRYIEGTIEKAGESCEVTTLLGRIRSLPDMKSGRPMVRKLAERAAVNTPIQGSAADLIKLAMIKMDQALEEKNMASRMILSVHDEILFETPEEEADELMALAREVMEGVFDLKVPLKVDIGLGKNWAEAH